MSYAMTHLIIANRFADVLNIKNKDLFLLANIAPDSVHSRADFTTRLKADAHFLQPNENWGEIYTEESMIIWYDRLRDIYNEKIKLVKNEDELIFLQGYTLHMLVDTFNCKLLYAKNLIAYNFEVDKMRGEYRRQCILQDNYLYQNEPANEKIMKAMLRAIKNEKLDKILGDLEFDKFISDKNLIDNANYQINGFRNANKACLTGLSMVSEESSRYFIDTVADEAIRILFSFPPVGDTFHLSEGTKSTHKDKASCES